MHQIQYVYQRSNKLRCALWIKQRILRKINFKRDVIKWKWVLADCTISDVQNWFSLIARDMWSLLILCQDFLYEHVILLHKNLFFCLDINPFDMLSQKHSLFNYIVSLYFTDQSTLYTFILATLFACLIVCHNKITLNAHTVYNKDCWKGEIFISNFRNNKFKYINIFSFENKFRGKINPTPILKTDKVNVFRVH